MFLKCNPDPDWLPLIVYFSLIYSSGENSFKHSGAEMQIFIKRG